jgi:hypothetical protein
MSNYYCCYCNNEINCGSGGVLQCSYCNSVNIQCRKCKTVNYEGSLYCRKCCEDILKSIGVNRLKTSSEVVLVDKVSLSKADVFAYSEDYVPKKIDKSLLDFRSSIMSAIDSNTVLLSDQTTHLIVFFNSKKIHDNGIWTNDNVKNISILDISPVFKNDMKIMPSEDRFIIFSKSSGAILNIPKSYLFGKNRMKNLQGVLSKPFNKCDLPGCLPDERKYLDIKFSNDIVLCKDTNNSLCIVRGKNIFNLGVPVENFDEVYVKNNGEYIALNVSNTIYIVNRIGNVVKKYEVSDSFKTFCFSFVEGVSCIFILDRSGDLSKINSIEKTASCVSDVCTFGEEHYNFLAVKEDELVCGQVGVSSLSTIKKLSPGYSYSSKSILHSDKDYCVVSYDYEGRSYFTVYIYNNGTLSPKASQNFDGDVSSIIDVVIDLGMIFILAKNTDGELHVFSFKV